MLEQTKNTMRKQNLALYGRIGLAVFLWTIIPVIPMLNLNMCTVSEAVGSDKENVAVFDNNVCDAFISAVRMKMACGRGDTKKRLLKA
jgi:hypothetical protein